MAIKYRILYDDYKKYKKRNILQKLLPYIFILLICTALILSPVSSPAARWFGRLLLPGDPDVTVQAFQQLANAIDRGENLSDALCIFCETVIDDR